jgi:hypothetical protein
VNVLRPPDERFAGLPGFGYEVEGGGHFVQEWGAPIAQAALKHFGPA